MPVIYNTIAEKTIAQIEEICDAEHCGDEDLEREIKSLFVQFRLYQDNRLKINKESRESKMAARKEDGGGAKRGASAKMTGVVKLVAIEGQENTFKVEKVSIPAPAPKPQTEEEEDNAPLAPKPKIKFVKKSAVEPEVNLAEDPEALATAVAEAAFLRQNPAVMAARAQKEAWKKSEAERKKQEGIAKRKATMAAKKEALANAAKTALVAEMNEDSDGERTDTDNEDEDDE